MSIIDRPQTFTEELANSISHGVGLLLAMGALPVLVDLAASRGRLIDIIGACVFSGTMILVYGASAAYHALPEGRTKRLFNRLDHAAIFLFMAGSYTPFSLAGINGVMDWAVFGLVWTLAAIGVVLKAVGRLNNPWLSNGFYLALGWLVTLALWPMVSDLQGMLFGLLIGGSATYTAGGVFFLLDSRVRYGHFIWHLFVLAGSTCHFFAALWAATGH
jgi:hemolysin III